MPFNPIKEIALLEEERENLSRYILIKLEKKDYHAVADAAMDLREIDAKLSILMKAFEVK